MLKRIGILVAIVVVGLAVLPLSAQPKGATDAYKEYLAAYAKAKSFDEVLPFLAKERVAMYKQTPAEKRGPMFEMMKAMDPTDVKVVKETPTPTGATLDLTGVDSEKKPVKGTVKMVKENGAWKVGAEDWQL